MIRYRKIRSAALLLSILILVQGNPGFQVIAATSQYSQNVSAWAETAVKTIYYYNLINDSFVADFDKPVERQEFAAIAVRMYEKAKGIRLDKPSKFDFTDIDNMKYKYEIQQAKNLGIVSGVGFDKFNPRGIISRQEICVMLFNTLRTIEPTVENTAASMNKFADGDKIASWALKAVNYMYNIKIIAGVGDNKIAPLNPSTREQTMVFFHRLASTRKYYTGLTSATLAAIRIKDKTFKAGSYSEYYRFYKNAIITGKCNLKIEINNYDSKIYSPFSDAGKIRDELKLDESSVFVPEYRTITYGDTTTLDIYIEYSSSQSSGEEDIMTAYDDYWSKSGYPTHNKPSDLIIIKDDASLSANLKKQISEQKTHIFIPITDLPTACKKDKITSIIKTILDKDPYMKWYVTASLVKAYSYTGSVGYDIRFYYHPRLNKEQIQATNTRFKEITDSVLKPDMTALEKEEALHDYIVSHTKYDYINFQNNTIPEESYTPYGAVVKGTAVCQGYAEALEVLFEIAGLETYVVYGEADNGTRGSHAWNIVKIDGRYYHVDSTWDDPVPDKGSSVLRKYFNLTDDQISKDHFWDRNEYPECK